MYAKSHEAPSSSSSPKERSDAGLEQQRVRWFHTGTICARLGRAAALPFRVARAALVEPVRCRSRERRDMLLLLSMSDHALADIGLMRIDLQAIAWGVIPVAQVGAGEVCGPATAAARSIDPPGMRSPGPVADELPVAA